MAAPTRTPLEMANEIRSIRAAKRRELEELPFQEGRTAVADLIEDPPSWMETARLSTVLCWPRRTGRSYMLRVILRASQHESFPIQENRRLGSLSPVTRKRIATMLREGVHHD